MEYMTVSEFATAAGVSRQAIYGALQGVLSDYVKDIDGKKHIESSALEVYAGGKLSRVTSALQDDSADVTIKLNDRIAELENHVAQLESKVDSLTAENKKLLGQLKDAEQLYYSEVSAHTADISAALERDAEREKAYMLERENERAERSKLIEALDHAQQLHAAAIAERAELDAADTKTDFTADEDTGRGWLKKIFSRRS